MNINNELQGDIFGNWIPVKSVHRAIKLDKRFFNKLKKKALKPINRIK